MILAYLNHVHHNILLHPRHNQKNASILNLVELFQDEKERSMMIQIAEMQKQAVEDEAEKMENMSSWKARILGVSKEDAI